MSHGTTQLGKGEQYTMSCSVPAAEIPCCLDCSVPIDSIVGIPQLEGGEIGEYLNKYLVGKLEHCEVVVRSTTNKCARRYLGLSGLSVHPGPVYE